jgi:ABC-type multidrug transport system ATPase subunit
MGETVLSGHTSLIIGRDPAVDMTLPAPSVSRRHARVNMTPKGPVLADLGSTNGTFVNGQRVIKPHPLKTNDIIQIGSFRLLYDGQSLQQYDQRGALRIDVRNLTLEIKGGRKILNNISLSIAPREFVALVGGSGAGKSTLMKAISGVSRATSGHVLVNGDDYYRNFDSYRSVLGYVPQYEILHRSLPVYDALDYAARLRLPGDTEPAEITERIEKSLEDVEMRDHTQTILDNLSGGQIKRVSIAGELLAEPSLFFLDEPTSGLDPGLEKKMMYTMRQLANSGRTVVLVTHATDNITQCDHVAFMSQGRLVYFGPPNEARQFFGVESGSFADIYTRLDGRADSHPDVIQTVLKQEYAVWKAQNSAQAEPTMGELWEARYRQSPQYQQYVVDRLVQTPQADTGQADNGRPEKPHISPMRQFGILTRRYTDLMLRDRRNLAILLLQAPIIAVLVWLLASPNALIGSMVEDTIQRVDAQNLLFILSVVAIWFGVINSAREITKERAIYRRERLSNLTILPYLSSKVTVLSVLMLIQNVSLLAILAIPLLERGVTFPTDTGLLLPAWSEIFITMMLTSLAGMAIGLFISSASRNADQAISLVPLVLIPQILFTGIIFKLESGITDVLSWFMVSRWSLDALGTSTHLAALCQLPNIIHEGAVDTQCVVNEELQEQPIFSSVEFLQRGIEPPDTFSNAFTYTTEHLLFTWGILLAFIIVGLMLTIWQLKQQDRQA